MERLLTDFTVRRGAQALLLGGLTILLFLEAFFLVLVTLHYFDRVEDFELQRPQKILFSLLSFPFQAEYGALATTVAATFPLVVSAICYQLDTHSALPASTSTLNRTGHICLFVLLSGVVFGLVNVFVSVLANIDIKMMAGSDENRIAIRNLFSVLLSFQLFYFLHILGFKK